MELLVVVSFVNLIILIFNFKIWQNRLSTVDAVGRKISESSCPHDSYYSFRWLKKRQNRVCRCPKVCMCQVSWWLLHCHHVTVIVIIIIIPDKDKGSLHDIIDRINIIQGLWCHHGYLYIFNLWVISGSVSSQHVLLLYATHSYSTRRSNQLRPCYAGQIMIRVKILQLLTKGRCPDFLQRKACTILLICNRIRVETKIEYCTRYRMIFNKHEIKRTSVRKRRSSRGQKYGTAVGLSNHNPTRYGFSVLRAAPYLAASTSVHCPIPTLHSRDERLYFQDIPPHMYHTE